MFSRLILASILLSAGTAHAFLGLPPTHETIFQKTLSSPYQAGSRSKAGFGVRYTSSAAISYQRALSSSYTDQLRTHAFFAIYAELFGDERVVFRATGSGYNNRNGTQYLDLSVYSYKLDFSTFSLRWQEIYGNRWTASATVPSASLSTSLFSAEGGPFWVGPIPVTVKATARGYVGWSGSVTLGTGGIIASVRPKAGIEARMSASVKAGWGDYSLAEAGVRGSLDLITAALPATGKLWVRPTYCGGVPSSWGIDYNLDVALTVELLSGYIELFADAIGISEKTYVLGSWSAPFSWNQALVADSNTVCF